ncbi:FbpB family small basic protein [Radiobacillus sp. PE A8.2]
MRLRKLSFEELVNQNKQELLNDEKAMKKIEEQVELKQASTVKKQLQNT